MKITRRKIIPLGIWAMLVLAFVSCRKDIAEPDPVHNLPGGNKTPSLCLGHADTIARLDADGITGCLDPLWDSQNDLGGSIEEEDVEGRIGRYGISHYDSARSPLAFSFKKEDLEDLASQFPNPTPENYGDDGYLPSEHCGGFRAYFGLTTINDFNSLRILLVAVDRDGNEYYPGEGKLPCVLGFDSNDTEPIVTSPTCLNLGNGSFIDPIPQTPYGRDEENPSFVKYDAAVNMTKLFRDYMVEENDTGAWDDKNKGFACKVPNCIYDNPNYDPALHAYPTQAYWLTSYTYCIEFFHRLLRRESPNGAASGIRFYFGIRQPGDLSDSYPNWTQHVPAICAIDSLYKDICSDNVTNDTTGGTYYIDWVIACPELCPGDLQNELSF